MTDQPDEQRPAEPVSDTGALNFGYRDAEGRQVPSSDATQVVPRQTTPPPATDPGTADRTQVVPRGVTPPAPQPPWGTPTPQQPEWGSQPGPAASFPPWQTQPPLPPTRPSGYGSVPQGWGQQPAQGQPPQGWGQPPQTWGQQQGFPQQQGQTFAPMQPGWGRLVVDTSFLPLAFILYLFGPLVTIDGQERARTWGRVALDVPAGQHRVDVLTRYLFPVAQASLDVVVQAGQEVPVFYRTPAVIFMSGAIGHVPQPTKGMGLTIGIFVVVLLLVVLDVALTLG